MSEVVLTLPATTRGAPKQRAAKTSLETLRTAFTYFAFALSVMFTFAVVVGVIH